MDGESDADVAPANICEPSRFSDEDLLHAAYDGPKYPEGFYHEDLGGGSLYYENTISITPTEERGDEWIELCTDDSEHAREWSEMSAEASSVSRELVGERETEKYFEFEREVSFFSRVHRCSYLDRSQYDRLHPGSVLGQLNLRPVTVESVQELSEYLWFISNCNNGSAKALCSAGALQEDRVEHTLLEILVAWGDWGLCDEITLIETVYHVDDESGRITYEQRELRTVQGICH